MIQAEGTDKVAPDSADIAYLLCDVNSYANFAEYGSTENNSLNIHLRDPENEIVYFGFSKAQTTPSAVGVSQDFLFRVVDEFGNIVFAEMLVDTNSANIHSHAEAIAGPNVPGIGTGYTPIIWDPSGVGLPRGDYRVEFARTSGNGAIAFEWWDITVANAGEVQPGRLWSREWALAVGGGSGNFFMGEFFIYTEDQFVYNFDFAGSEFKPIWFSLFFNASGPGNSGDRIADRRSVPGKSGDPLYRIFINDPDAASFANATLGSISSSVITGCSPADYCINIEASQEGSIELFLDLDTTSGHGIYDPGTADTMFFATINSTLETCIPWDGRDGMGNLIPSGTDFKSYIQFKRGVANFPIYDVEFNRKGFNIDLTRPEPTPAFSLEMYWDHSLVPDTADLAFPNQPKVNLNGCDADCNPWTNKSFGDKNTINSWWEVVIDSSFEYSIGAFSQADAGNDSLLCSAGVIQLAGSINLSTGGTNNGVAVWQTLTDGAFSDSLDVNATYTPGPADIIADGVALILYPNGCPGNGDTVYYSFNSPGCEPVIQPDGATLMEDAVEIIAVLANDADPYGLDTGSLVILTPPVNGTATPNFDGTVTYTPDAHFHGTDSFVYQICDTDLPVNCGTATVYLTIFPVNDPPLVQNDSLISFDLGVPTTINVLDNDSDPFDPLGGLDTASLTVVVPPAFGMVAVDPLTGTIDYTTGLGFSDADTFAYVICDLGNPIPALCDTGWVYLRTNSAPTLSGVDTLPVDYCFGEQILSPAVEVADLDGDSLTATALVSSGYLIGQDSLSINIPMPVSWDATTGTLTFGPAPSIEIQAALRSLSYSNVRAPGGETGAGRTIAFELTDGEASSIQAEVSLIYRSNDPAFCDADADGMADGAECPGGPLCDPDGDNIPNYLDNDSDGDGLEDSFEAGADPGSPEDSDMDGTPDFIDPDSDNDGIADETEVGDDPSNPVDTDGDGLPDYLDLDSDGDLIPDNVEAQNPLASGSDSDGDGIDDAFDTDNGGPGLNFNPIDTDGDGAANYVDLDSESDTLSDAEEAGPDPDNPVDTDGDGLPDYIDFDSDNDGLSDEAEAGGDCDGDGLPNQLDPESCQLEIVEIFTPNGDGINDALHVFGVFDHPDNEIQVFNRYGELVFMQRSYQNDWEGIHRSTGEALPSGTYYYLFKSDYSDSESIELNGHTTIWR